MSVKIPLGGRSRGLVAIVDDEDAERVLRFTWFLKSSNSSNETFYAGRSPCFGVPDLLHRFILHVPSGLIVDHRDFNGLNNVRSNLRVCTLTDNNAHTRRDNPTGYRGIYIKPGRSKWYARAKRHGRLYTAGGFSSIEEAARAYDKMAFALHGEFAILNFPNSAEAF